MKKYLLGTLLMSASCLYAATPNHPDSVYIFSYCDNPGDGLHLAYSIDRRTWNTLGSSPWSFVKSDFGTWGGEKKMYHPSLALDGQEWFVVWGVNDRTNQFATTRTSDLWLWKPQDYPYMKSDGNVLVPVLSKQGDKFKVYYKNSSGKSYVTESSDYRSWSTPQVVTEEQYNAVQKEEKILLNGFEKTGEVHRAPYSTLTYLQAKVAQAQWKAHEIDKANDPAKFRANKSQQATLHAKLSDSKPISSDLIGIFFEDINYSADGGLYAELIQNRDFEYNELDRGEWNAKSFWELKGDGTTWEISTESPIHANNSHYAVLTTTEQGASLQNNGFDGIPLSKGEKYDLSLFTKSMDGRAHKIIVKITDGNTIIAQTTFTAYTNNWKQLKAVLKAGSDTEKATLCIEPQDAGSIALDFVSLFPQNTFKGRKNGLRRDLAQALADLHPRFIRFPGGCVSHGNGLENMYRWRTTVGPLWERKSQSNIWGYHQSKGLGFFEYFQFCEDIGAEPLPVLPAGVPCQNSSRGGYGQQGGVPMSEMEAYTQELLDLIEWANGDAKTSALAKLRADAGHPQPFNLKMLGVGNEDLISDVFVERFNYINQRIKAKYPEIKVVGTVGPNNEGSDYEYGWQLAREQHIGIVDEHYYVNPGWYIQNQQFYDRYDREGTKVYLGEWASWGNRLENALAEALHVTNLERNADVVVMSSYAPLLAKHGHTQWNPDLIYFNNTQVFPTVNYHVQRLCGNNSGSEYIYSQFNVDVKRDGRDGNDVTLRNENAVRSHLSNSIVRDAATGDVIIKLVNMTPLETPVDVALENFAGFLPKADVSCISGELGASDIVPEESTISVGEQFSYVMPANSFSVIRLKAAKKARKLKSKK